MDKTKKAFDGQKAALAALIALGLFFFGFAVVRAAKVAITFDEVITLYYYVKKGFLGLFKFDASNNHLLNTLLVWLVTRVAGTSEFALRIPNLAGYLLYLVFSARLLRRYAPAAIAVCGFVVLNANPYLQDFFALSRGYGLSLGLLMAALFCLLRFAEETRDGSPRASRTLTTALLAAAASVLASFTLLIVYLSIGVVAAAVIALSPNRRFRPPEPADGHPRRSNRRILYAAAWAAIALLLNLRAFSYGFVTSPRMFEPVTVKIGGLDPNELTSAEVLGPDIFKVDIPMILKNGIWAPESPLCMTGITLKVPRTLVEKITDVEVRIGQSVFHDQDRILEVRSAPHNEPLIEFSLHDHVSLPHPDFAEIANAINWKGRPAYDRALVISLAAFLAIFSGLIGIGTLAGRLLQKYRLLNIRPFLPIWRVTLALAAVAGGPIFILHDKGEFVFIGGSPTLGEAVLSLVNNSIYGRRILGSGALPWIAAAFVLAALFLFAGLMRAGLKKLGPNHRAGVVLSSVFALAILAVFVQYIFLGVLFMNGRRALFFIPLTLLFVIFGFVTMDSFGRARLWTRALLVALTVLYAAHFAKTANTSITFDWRFEADHKAVLADIEQMRRAGPQPDSDVRLGLDFHFYPGMVYLKEQRDLSWLKLDVVPPYQPEDYYYFRGPFDKNRMVLVKQYPTGNILVKEKF